MWQRFNKYDKNKLHIDLKNLTKNFESKGVVSPAFENISLTINEGEFVAILGPSGCGKSTLLRILAELETPSSGEFFIKESINEISMVFQEHGLFPWMTLQGNIEFVLQNNPQISAKNISSITQKYLKIVGLTEYANYLPHQASGGMKQRVAIARCFANDPDILLMDEPFVFLDFQSRMLIHELLLSIWQNSKKTVLFVTHDIEEAVLLADRIIVLSARPGNIVADEKNVISRPRDLLAIRKQPEFSDKVTHYINLIRHSIMV